jgi:3-methyladenine DNA glycosylase/8-oxoguanine DNA glycosylase
MKIFQYGPAEIDHLKRRDNKLGRAIDHIGMIERQVMPDLFKALVHSVEAQQISRKDRALNSLKMFLKQNRLRPGMKHSPFSNG